MRTVRSLGTVESFCLRTQQQWENGFLSGKGKYFARYVDLCYVSTLNNLLNYLALHFAMTTCCQSL